MKQLTIIANWKANKTESEAKLWFASFEKDVLESSSKTVIVCPPDIHIPTVFPLLKGKISLGVQNISVFDQGAYTGEIPVSILPEYVEYILIGHSERRTNFSETDEVLSKKVLQAKHYKRKVLFCVQGKETPVPEGVAMVAYEPVAAIGTGTPDTPENANEIAQFLKEKYHLSTVLYGGSVNSENVNSFTTQAFLDGVLVGSKSLDPASFAAIVNNA